MSETAERAAGADMQDSSPEAREAPLPRHKRLLAGLWFGAAAAVPFAMIVLIAWILRSFG
jgi:hypothetical protein